MKDLRKCKTKEEVLKYYLEKQKQKEFEKKLKKIIEIEELRRYYGQKNDSH